MPLFLIVVTGVIMSYAWANNLLYRMTGNVRRRKLRLRLKAVPDGILAGSGPYSGRSAPSPAWTNCLLAPRQQVPGWTTISLRLPDSSPGERLTLPIDQGNGGRPTCALNLL